MGFKVDYTEKDSDTFEVFLKGISVEGEEAERKMLKEAGEQVKKYVVANLDKHRRALAKRYKGRPAMADDVKVSTRKDRNGNLAARVQGGRRTGSLWHIVNDGHLHSRPTHFMDDALKSLDGRIDNMWDKVMR
ncbi:MAG TPA: HK97-gp10 family putative phage morphogenesis protein [Bacillota bacterium]|nr:HK97-gp10 family putative phage morphogenesis protein [Bacillota bacterium]